MTVNTCDFDKLRRLSADIRIETIRAISNFGMGHIGGAISIADVLAVLYGDILKIDPKNPQWEDRDWLVLSKGHSGPGLYVALALKGYFDKEMLKTLNQPGTKLPSHCDRLKTPGIDMTTGSLGQGISCALGVAMGMRMQGRANRVYCILGDGELQEGQVWEAVQCAAHNNVDNLTLLVDYNKIQLDGKLESICRPYDLVAKFTAFGMAAEMVKGYSVEDIHAGIQRAIAVKGRPAVVILDTYKGLGCNFAEQASFNHYMSIDKEMADGAIAEIEKRFAAGTYPGGDFKW